MRLPYLPLLASSVLPSLISAQLSTSDIASVFGAQATGLTGASVVLPQFTLSVVLNATSALFSLNATSSKPYQVGWMGTAIGGAMASASDFLLTWPNPATATGAASTPWTLSHRATQGEEAQPLVASSNPASITSALYTFLPALSSSDPNSPFTVVSYIRPLSFANGLTTSTSFKPLQPLKTEFIYASSTVQPGSTAENAVLTQHDQAHATTMLDLSAPITLNGPSSPSSPASSGAPSSAPLTTTSAGGRSKRDMYIIAHAVLGSLALLLFTPIAILIARYFRGSSWYPSHAGINLFAAALIVACFGIGVYVNGSPHFDDTHTRVGLALFIIVILQMLLGFGAHAIPAPAPADVSQSRLPTLTGKNPVRLLHIFMGIATVVLGWVQVHLGFDEWESDSDALTKVPRAVIIVYWILLAVIAVLYLGGWGKEASGRRRSYGNGGAEKVGSVDQ